jgi:hypothetical protein
MAAREGAYRSWANTDDWSARTRNGRAAFEARFEREVDPDGVLAPAERAKRAEAARKAYYLRMSRLAVAARRAKR